LNVKSVNVNIFGVTYGKCVLNDNHDMCAIYYISGVNFRTKKLIVMPISTREPKQKENQSIATPNKKTVASETTIKKPRSTFKKLYEHLVEIILFIVDSGCSKHITGNLKLLRNSMDKFMGMVKFGNDQFALNLRYGDLVQGNITIKRVYYVKGLNHDLFSIGQFCDADLEVVFQKSTCYVRDLKGNVLLIGSRGTDLYSITLQDTTSPNLICLMAKASSSQAWLYHRHLSHLNFDTINLLSKNDIMIGFLKLKFKLKFIKDHLCSSCELRKAKQKYFKTKITPSSKRRLQLLHMDLCDPMRVESMNGKKYVLVIIDDYSRYTWTHFLGPKTELLTEIVATSLNELDMLFSLMFDEYFTGATTVVSKSSIIPTTDASNKRQQSNKIPPTLTTIAADLFPLIIQTTPEPTILAPTQAPTITATENND
nr:retrovirus-related Pol polyprotein from transposon TNT 1-94 [Tanacetum cinerariifolium]